MEDSDVPDKGEMATDEKEQEKREEQKEEARLAHAARLRNAQKLAHMYCPCTGYAFNALDGRQLLVSRLRDALTGSASISWLCWFRSGLGEQLRRASGYMLPRGCWGSCLPGLDIWLQGSSSCWLCVFRWWGGM